MTVHRCLQGKAPQYLVNCCHPISDVASRWRLRSSSRHDLVVPRHRRSTLGRRAFSVAGPMAWNALPDDLRDPSLSADNFRQFPEEAKNASVSECTWTRSALEALRNALYKFKTYLLTRLKVFWANANLKFLAMVTCSQTQRRMQNARSKFWNPHIPGNHPSCEVARAVEVGGGQQTGVDSEILRPHQYADFGQRSASVSTGRCYIRSAVNSRPQ